MCIWRRGLHRSATGVDRACTIQSRRRGEPWRFRRVDLVTIDCASKSIVSPLCTQEGEKEGTGGNGEREGRVRALYYGRARVERGGREGG